MGRYIAIDLGAESGRVVLGSLAGGRVRMKEIHRFSNDQVRRAGFQCWDLDGIRREILRGLRKCASHQPIAGIGCDSWGVDYVPLTLDGRMQARAITYRDPRTHAAFARIKAKVSPARLFSGTGIGCYPFNTINQLFDDLASRPGVIKRAQRILLIADWVNWSLTGVARSEVTLASTTQCWDSRSRSWAHALLREAGIPSRMFAETINPGTTLGALLPQRARQCRLAALPVHAVCAHDTACAVAATPAQGRDWAFLSSGTWSLLGVEAPAPIVNGKVQRANFTNEAGLGGSTCFLKCLVGLWILQEVRREWGARATDYSRLVRLAARAAPLKSLIRPDAIQFSHQGEMTRKIQEYCRATAQRVPKSRGEIVRCVLESLALLYGMEVDQLERLTNRHVRVLHIIGGGSQNDLLNQMTANATGRRVVAGPVEATAMGNLLVQAIATGELSGIAQLRRVVRDSTRLRSFAPAARRVWRREQLRFASLPTDLPGPPATLPRRKAQSTGTAPSSRARIRSK